MGRPLVTQTGISARQALSLLSFQCLFYFLSLGVRFRRWGRFILPSNLCSSLREKLLLWVSAPALQRPQRRPHPAATRSPPRQRLFPTAFHLPFGLQSKPMLHGAVFLLAQPQGSSSVPEASAKPGRVVHGEDCRGGAPSSSTGLVPC